MKLKLTLLTFCLFGVGIFSHAQSAKTGAPAVKFKAPGNAPRDKDGRLLPPPPPPKVELTHFKAPKGLPRDKDGNILPPPPPPAIDKHGRPTRSKAGDAQPRFIPPKIVKDKPVTLNTPPQNDKCG